MEAILPFLIIGFILPVAVGYYANSIGRSFWLWWFLSMILPIISMVILLLMKAKEEEPKPETE